ncbi:RebB family R body protein [Pseudogulbenkiania subflava]|uniref:Killing trait domain-containing protein n=1 Tax=Pseudogulbenkiania subflava DSM 22618 TaxID=1123014 RepID=A0A1Y6CF17_9NEIS|nr:RebB family R body protein [Pseudogulbenkiania subflava]SMF52846.1 Killing trait domain-containing protein [Pseudogulbenkiania subflava DSM 22618]
MADPTLVNGQITDAATQTNVKVLGEAPAEALGTLEETVSQSLDLSMENAQQNQQPQDETALMDRESESADSGE